MSKSKKLIIIIASVIVAAGLLVGTMNIGRKLFVDNSFEEAKAEFLKYATDSDMSFWAKSCDLEIVRNLTLAKKYGEAGLILAEIIKEGDFLEKYYVSILMWMILPQASAMTILILPIADSIGLTVERK